MKKRLLIVDDDSSVREALKRVLMDSGYEVILAADGSEAEQRLSNAEIDLLILDLNMPNRDGWDVMEAVTSNHPWIPIIVVTGMMDQLATFDIPGVAALLPKPVEAPALLHKIERLLAESVETRLEKSRNDLEWASSGASIGRASLGANAAKGLRRS
jgi:DNA-binding NtrC family response regulator